MMFQTALLLFGAIVGLLLKIALDMVLARKHKHNLFERIGRWWRSALDKPPESIEYRTREGIQRGVPIRAAGLHLLVEQRTGAKQTILVSAGEAMDRDAFWKAWKYFGGQSAKYVDEDGDPWEPE